jgi:hypothetical protein
MDRNRPESDRPSWGHAPERPWAELSTSDRVRYVLVVLSLIGVLILAGAAGSGPAL